MAMVPVAKFYILTRMAFYNLHRVYSIGSSRDNFNLLQGGHMATPFTLFIPAPKIIVLSYFNIS